MRFTVFYDGRCPLCSAEMAMLKRLDRRAALQLEDIHAPDFNRRYPQINVVEANKILHGLAADGTPLYGLDVTVGAWRTVGKKRWLVVLRWPGIRRLADIVYLLFARHRSKVSALLAGRSSMTCQGRSDAPNTALSNQARPAKNCARVSDEDAEF